MQKARGHASQGGAPTACKPLVSDSLSLPLQGFFSPFPYGTSSLSVADEYLALGDGPPGFPRGFTCPAVLRYLAGMSLRFGYEAITRSGGTFQSSSPAKKHALFEALQPRMAIAMRFGLIPFRSPLLWESLLISFPVGTEMFHFPTFASPGLWIQPGDDRI